jgi:hypothetical protein
MNAFEVGFQQGMIKSAKHLAGSARVTSTERAKYRSLHGDVECSLGRDDQGLYVYTHRARCKSYPTVDDIPVSKVKFIASTS